MHSGALQKLFYTVGNISGALQTENTVRWIRYVPVYKWKGQLPKQLTTKRTNRRYKLDLDWKTKEHNAADAIGIGHWFLNERRKK